jgi:hypothetical protein
MGRTIKDSNLVKVYSPTSGVIRVEMNYGKKKPTIFEVKVAASSVPKALYTISKAYGLAIKNGETQTEDIATKALASASIEEVA